MKPANWFETLNCAIEGIIHAVDRKCPHIARLRAAAEADRGRIRHLGDRGASAGIRGSNLAHRDEVIAGPVDDDKDVAVRRRREVGPGVGVDVSSERRGNGRQ